MNTGPDTGQNNDWGYHGHVGPSRWGELGDEFAVCSFGSEQSPVNIETGDAEPADLTHITFHYTPSEYRIVNNGHTIETDSLINPAALLPSNRDYFADKGSLTTPPCSENVRWCVLKMPVALSVEQINAFQALYPMNARPVQPVNDRVTRSNN